MGHNALRTLTSACMLQRIFRGHKEGTYRRSFCGCCLLITAPQMKCGGGYISSSDNQQVLGAVLGSTSTARHCSCPDRNADIARSISCTQPLSSGSSKEASASWSLTSLRTSAHFARTRCWDPSGSSHTYTTHPHLQE